MSDSELLAQRLRQLARRLHRNRLSRELATAGCWLFGALLVYQILGGLITAAPVLGALRALWLLALVMIALFYLVRLSRPTTLAAAAAVADERAHLKDELKTAQWFAREGTDSPLALLQLQRALRSAQSLDPRAVAPPHWPRSLPIALALALTAAGLALLPPKATHLGLRASTALAASEALAAPRGHARALLPATGLALPTAEADAREQQGTTESPASGAAQPRGSDAAPERTGTGGASDAAWRRLDAMARSLEGSSEGAGLAAAIQSRDAARVAELMQELQHKRSLARAQANLIPHGEQVKAESDRGVMAALQSLFSDEKFAKQAESIEASEDELQRAVNIAQKLDEDGRPRVNNPAQHTVDEQPAAPDDRAVPLSSYGPRQAARGRGEGGEPAGTTNVEGGAMGRRISQSQAGAGGSPSGSEQGGSRSELGADPVLGKQTLRLDVQLQRLKIESGNDSSEAQGLADRVYAATRAQRASLAYQAGVREARYASEQATSGEQVPLTYRDIVKDYFLNLRQKEE